MTTGVNYVLAGFGQAAYDSLRSPLDGVPIYRLRRLLQWPRERFDAVLEALRAAQAVELEGLVVVGAEYSLETGMVNFLDGPPDVV